MFHEHGPKMYGAATVGEKGQIVIPVEARKELGINPGSRVMFLAAPMGKALLVVPAAEVEAKLQFFNDTLGLIQKDINNEQESND